MTDQMPPKPNMFSIYPFTRNVSHPAMDDWLPRHLQILFHLSVQPQVLPLNIPRSFFSYPFSTLYLSQKGYQAGCRMECSSEAFWFICEHLYGCRERNNADLEEFPPPCSTGTRVTSLGTATPHGEANASL
jgi:hypothetical protein